MSEILLIFIFTFSIVILLSQFGVIVNNRDIAFRGKFRWNRYYFLSFIILTLFLGTREGVGVDFLGYKEIFETGSQFFKLIESNELGYIWLIDILHFFNLDYHSFFWATSFITVLLLFNSFKNAYQLLPMGIFLFFVGDMYVFIINGVRQGIAMMAFYNALRYINPDGDVKDKFKNLFWFYFYIAIGALFHYPILIFVPLVFILKKRFLSLFNTWILTIIILSGFIINSDSFLDVFSNAFMELFPKYKVYAGPSSQLLEVGGFGLGAVLILFVSLVPILFYDKIKKEFPASRKYFVLYAFGTSLMYAFQRYMLVGRMILYLSLCSIFVLAYTYSYLKKQSKRGFIYLILNISIISFLVVKFIYVLPEFIEVQILGNNYSLWFIPLMK